MRSLLLMICLTVFCASGFAQNASSNVAAIAAKYDAEVREITNSRAAAEIKLRQTYLSELDAAEKEATGAGKLQEAEVLRMIKEAVTSGRPSAPPATKLSKEQAKRLADYVAALVGVDREYSPRYSRVSTDCLRSLATIESSLPAGSLVRQEIQTVKNKILSSAAGGLTERLKDTKWQWWESAFVEFRGGGKGVFRDVGGPKDFQWKTTADGKVLFTRDDSPGATFTLEFTESQMKITNPEGKSWQGKALGPAK